MMWSARSLAGNRAKGATREFVVGIWWALFCYLSIFSASGRMQEKPATPIAKPAPAQQKSESKSESDSKALEKVLAQLDAAAASFRTAQANFVWELYQKVVDSKDYQKGTIYYRRQGKGIEMMADLSDPKSILFRDGRIQVSQPNTDVKTYEAGKDRETVESFLVLGFGGSGHDLLKQFDVKYLGEEPIDGVKTAKLELIPKSERVRNVFGRIWLWIDPSRGISLQQQFFDERSGDYRLAKYTAIQLNQKLADSVFKLRTYPDVKRGSAPKS